MATMTADLMLVEENMLVSAEVIEHRAEMLTEHLDTEVHTEVVIDHIPSETVQDELVVGEHRASEHQEPAGWRPDDISVVVQPYRSAQPVQSSSLNTSAHQPNSPANVGSLPSCGPLEALSWVATHDELGECMICLEELQKGQLVTCLPCAHNFHNDCILRWFGTKINQYQNGCCPNCNLTIVAPVLRMNSGGTTPGTSGTLIPRPQSQFAEYPNWNDDVVSGSHCCGKTLTPQSRQLAVIFALFFFCCALGGTVFLSFQASGKF